VAGRAGTGEADCARVERVEQLMLHRAHVVARCVLLEGARTMTCVRSAECPMFAA